MTTYDRLYEVHKALLLERGFGEQSRSNLRWDGFLFEELRHHFDQCVKEIALGRYRSRFSLRTTGFFIDDEQAAHYRLDYCFDATMPSLDITKMEIRWKGRSQVFKLRSNEDLPYATAAFDELKQYVLKLQERAANRVKRPGSGAPD